MFNPIPSSTSLIISDALVPAILGVVAPDIRLRTALVRNSLPELIALAHLTPPLITKRLALVVVSTDKTMTLAAVGGPHEVGVSRLLSVGGVLVGPVLPGLDFVATK
jgi:hypothetical protein